jgi:hypothetical protein
VFALCGLRVKDRTDVTIIAEAVTCSSCRRRLSPLVCDCDAVLFPGVDHDCPGPVGTVTPEDLVELRRRFARA